MNNGHSAIDSLIAQVGLQSYQKGGKVEKGRLTAAESFERFWDNYYKPSPKGKYGEGPDMGVRKERLKKVWEESGSPYIKEMDLHGFKHYDQTIKKEIPRPEGISSSTSMVGGSYGDKNDYLWESEYDPEADKWYKTTPRAFFNTAEPERKINVSNLIAKMAKSYVPGLQYLYPTPSVFEYERVPTDTTYITPGNIYELIAELGHAGQYAPLSQQEIYTGEPKRAEEWKKYGDVTSDEERGVYGQKGTHEYDAHSVREPLLRQYIYGTGDKLELPPSWYEKQ